jgi:prepilin-type N-terminal cleavage/methylation domain-containing protein
MGRVGKTQARLGFSLVELLVVIGIIVVLLSLLLPSLAKVRQSGWAVTCQSNQRQLMMAFREFAFDHDGSLPGNYFDSIHQQPIDPYKRDWLLGDNPNQGNEALQWLDGPQKGTIFPYVNDAKLYLCPAYEPSFLNAGAGTNGRFDYAATLVLAGAHLTNVKLDCQFRYTNGSIANDVFTPVIVEEEPQGGINGGNVEGGHSNTDRLGHYHNGGGYYAAIDGSVHWFQEPLNENSLNWYSLAPSGKYKTLGLAVSPSWGVWNKQ